MTEDPLYTRLCSRVDDKRYSRMAEELFEEEYFGFDFEFDGLPYQFEPEYTEEELQEMEEEERRRAVELQQEMAETQPRVAGNLWCVCGRCEAMATEEECLCCHEWDLLHRGQDSPRENGQCFTEVENFSGFLNPMVLEAFFHVPKVNWKRQPKPEGPNGQLSAK